MQRTQIQFLCVLFLLLSFFSKAQSPVTQTYSFSGATQTFVMPACTGNFTIQLKGAKGGDGGYVGGQGAALSAVCAATPGAILYITVGGVPSLTLGGFNGGGNGGVASTGTFVNKGTYNGAGGGGATDLRIGGTASANRVLVAGGGGGASGDPNFMSYGGAAGNASVNCTGIWGGLGLSGQGYANGGYSACAGYTLLFGYGTGGGGGGLTGPGGGGTGPDGAWGSGGSGPIGGNGGGATPVYGGTIGGISGGGGGGGGYFGGGGGFSGNFSSPLVTAYEGGGGGGSSFANLSLFTNAQFTGTSTANAYVSIIYNYTNSPLTVTGPTVLCPGGTVSLYASGASTYTWLPGSNFLGATTNSVNIAPSVSSNYSVVGTTSLGCPTSTVISLNVLPLVPSITVSSSAQTPICFGQTVTLNASGANNYTWTPNISNAVPFVPTVSQAYSVVASNGCGTISAIANVSVTPLHSISIVPSASAVCIGGTVSLTALSTGANSYLWYSGLNLLSTNSTAIVSPTTTSTYSVIVTASTCSAMANTQINTLALPTLTLTSANNTLCLGQTATLQVNGANTYSWNNLPGTQSLIITPSTNTLITVVGMNTNGCVSSLQSSITVYPLPVINAIANPTLVCSGKPSTLQVFGSNTYTWHLTNGAIINSSVQVSPLNTTNYSITQINSFGCASASIIPVTIYSPTFSISHSGSCCIGQAYPIQLSGASNYSVNGNFAFPSFTLQPNSSSNITISALSFSNAVSCISNSLVSIQVYTLPVITAMASKTSICVGESNTLTANGATSYTWSSLQTGSLIPVIGNATNTNFQVAGSDANSCVNSASVSFNVSACLGLSNIALDTDRFIVAPNPSDGSFTIQGQRAESLQLINQVGQVLFELQLSPQNHYTQPLQDLPPGIYYLVGPTKSLKIVVTN